MTWHAVDRGGRDAATGRAPVGAGHPSPLAALRAVPVATWPLVAVAPDGAAVGVAEALGPSGSRVAALLDALADALADDSPAAPPEDLLRATPAGRLDLPPAVVGLREGADAAGRVDGAWLAAVDRRRSAAHRALVAAGRAGEAEAALHLAMLLATERFDPSDDADVDAHVASGARLWLLTGAVVSALAGTTPDPFAAWARLVVSGWWPIGPSGGRLVVSGCGAGAPARRAG